MNCEAVQAGNLAEKYVLGEMAEADQTAFEEHYYICDRCLDEVRLLQALQAATEATPARRKVVLPNWAWGAIAAVLIAAAGLGSWLMLQLRSVPPPAVAKIAPPARPADSNSAVIAMLAMVDAPRYVPSRLRGVSGSREEAFRNAMQAYASNDYGAAAEQLRPLAKPSQDAVAPMFYLGICGLMTGNPRGAAEQFRAIEAQGDTPYLEPARFYMAKALLAGSDVNGAAEALEKAIGMKGDRESEARQLLARIRALPRRP